MLLFGAIAILVTMLLAFAGYAGLVETIFRFFGAGISIATAVFVVVLLFLGVRGLLRGLTARLAAGMHWLFSPSGIHPSGAPPAHAAQARAAAGASAPGNGRPPRPERPQNIVRKKPKPAADGMASEARHAGGSGS